MICKIEPGLVAFIFLLRENKIPFTLDKRNTRLTFEDKDLCYCNTCHAFLCEIYQNFILAAALEAKTAREKAVFNKGYDNDL